MRPRSWSRLSPLVHYGLLRRDPDSTPDRSAHPPRDLRQGLADRALITVLVLTTLWIIVFGRLIYLRHARFGTFDFDLGIHDQAIWQMAHGHGFLTVRGLPALGHHATFAYWFFAPF